MAKKEETNKIITIVLAIVISLAALTILYFNLPDSDESDDKVTPSTGETILTVSYEDESIEYDLNSLENKEEYTGSGGYIKTKLLPDSVVINGPWEFTGVQLSTFLSDFEDLPNNYNVTITASDGWISEYTKQEVQGNVNIYNESGEIIETSGATMIIAYKEEGEYISEEDGPLRVAFLGDNMITESNLWSKMVESIEITEV
jgi:hypothetical protein